MFYYIINSTRKISPEHGINVLCSVREVNGYIHFTMIQQTRGYSDMRAGVPPYCHTPPALVQHDIQVTLQVCELLLRNMYI